jgi:DNA polymerase-1
MKHSFNFKVISKTDGGAPQTNKDVLWKLSLMNFSNKRKREGVEACKLLLVYSKLAKLNSAFITGLLGDLNSDGTYSNSKLYDDGKAHPNFNIIGTDSGRISCSEPNLQQLPKADEEDKYQIRSLFIGSEYVADEDGNYLMPYDVFTGVPNDNYELKRMKIIAIDYSNLEIRVNAHFSEDPNLLDMFAKGDDVHGSTAVNMFELDCEPNECKKKYPHLSQVGKVLNFLLIYGGGAPTLYNNLKSNHENPIDLGDKKYLEMFHCKNGIEVAQIYIDKYFTSYKGVAKFIRDQKRYAHKHEYVQTLLRRKRRLPDINSRDFKVSSYCERLSVNSPVQGSAADITMSAQNLVNNDPWFVEHHMLMLLQVHDEIVFECPEEYVEEGIARARALMEHPFGPDVELNLPLRADADSGDSYQEAK